MKYVWTAIHPANFKVTSHQIATDEDSGILLYKGDKDHIAVELYRGRVRASYDTGSPPGFCHLQVRSQLLVKVKTVA